MPNSGPDGAESDEAVSRREAWMCHKVSDGTSTEVTEKTSVPQEWLPSYAQQRVIAPLLHPQESSCPATLDRGTPCRRM